MLATLKYPVMGYVKIRLIVKRGYKWLVELVGADLEIEVYEDDFVIENSWKASCTKLPGIAGWK